MEFNAFPKIHRYNRAVVITEKIDGTNAQIEITREELSDDSWAMVFKTRDNRTYHVRAGSRNRYLTKENDNFGFCNWVWSNLEEIVILLGEGRHYGEWWGNGIQRGYGLKEKRFSLFNTDRWHTGNIPECCHVVPVLGNMDGFDNSIVESALSRLREKGSFAAPGFMKPEGIVMYHTKANILLKKTLEKDEGKNEP